MNNEQSMKLIDFNIPVTRVLAIGRFTKKAMNAAKRLPVMTKEVPATLHLYLTGKIAQWFVKPDLSGPVFIMNATTVEEAYELLETLPLGLEGMMDFDLIPLGTLTPISILLNDQVAN